MKPLLFLLTALTLHSQNLSPNKKFSFEYNKAEFPEANVNFKRTSDGKILLQGFSSGIGNPKFLETAWSPNSKYLAERSPVFVKELAEHHTPGQLSVAPEHTKDDVLDKMKKPGIESYERFVDQFQCATEEAGKDQHLVPYFISGHPGSDLGDMVDLALYLKGRGIRPRQVQDFIPTPMSMATSMYLTGLDPFTSKPVFTAKTLKEKRLQKSLLLYWDPSQHDLTREALVAAGRADLIGTGPRALVPPATGKGALPRYMKSIKKGRRKKRHRRPD